MDAMDVDQLPDIDNALGRSHLSGLGDLAFHPNGR